MRVLDPLDDMNLERIKVEVFINNIKKYYQIIIDTGYTCDDFFYIAREKNQKLEDVQDEAKDQSAVDSDKEETKEEATMSTLETETKSDIDTVEDLKLDNIKSVITGVKKKKLNYLDLLPVEVLASVVFKHFSLKQLMTCGQVCREWK